MKDFFNGIQKPLTKKKKKTNCIKVKNFYAFKDNMIYFSRGTKARYSRKRDWQAKGSSPEHRNNSQVNKEKTLKKSR